MSAVNCLAARRWRGQSSGGRPGCLPTVASRNYPTSASRNYPMSASLSHTTTTPNHPMRDDGNPPPRGAPRKTRSARSLQSELTGAERLSQRAPFLARLLARACECACVCAGVCVCVCVCARGHVRVCVCVCVCMCRRMFTCEWARARCVRCVGIVQLCGRTCDYESACARASMCASAVGHACVCVNVMCLRVLASRCVCVLFFGTGGGSSTFAFMCEGERAHCSISVRALLY